MKNVIVVLFCFFFALNAKCQSLDSIINLDTLKAIISRDILLREYSNALDTMVELIATGRISFKNVDMACIKAHEKEGQTREIRLQIYQEAGMKNVQTFLDASDAIMFTYAKIIQKYPKLMDMPISERVLFLKSITPPVKKLDRKETMEKRRRNGAND